MTAQLTSEAETASFRLRTAMTLLVPGLSRSGTRLWDHPDLAAVYPRYLVAMHQVIRASVPLMIEAAQALREPARPGGYGPGDEMIADYLERHAPEEADHDEWVVEDLERIGTSRAELIAIQPFHGAAALVGAQYYYIKHHDPAAILGYIAQLEGYPPDEDALLAAARRTGLPTEAFRTLRKHSHLDPHHRRDLDRLLDALPPDPSRRTLILRSAVETGVALVGLIDEICARPHRAPGSEPGPR